ncbi:MULTISPECIES: MFS transporter [unclassified Actinomyces]|uniref:MFS transporter n=1 Tax=unclassified Actinomyces TaxID=2609248 RepID=UPI00201747C0|nr:MULTISPECIES: MFS transporter [unclassified Actinomyces]MCL3777370.1 MFS transporter [Actinomyces sp. AC-20-1]MCL3789339.1 MFS transporter [Actinomyces sp. 187325]MCL3792521.1 MFS transporter [Actinomyces sp. 186855]MCL3794006.1 MFS transporter [Actinomyces sp. 217892]
MSSADSATTAASGTGDHGHAVRRAAKASFIGNFIEWFDYASYGYLASVIGLVFFPESSPTGRLLYAFAVFATSFILRPVGAVVWGILGDRLGRRWALSWSILIMSGATFVVGILPGYNQIGLWAAVALVAMRMCQGFSASGEYAGAGTFLAEYAPPSKRGIYVSLVPASTACGLLMGSLFVSGLYAFLDDTSMVTWGWRVPFLLAGPLGLVGRYIRVHLEDSPAYQALVAKAASSQTQQAPSRSRWAEPLRLLLTSHRRALLACFGVSCLNAVAFYMLLSYMPNYVEHELGHSETAATLATSVTLVVYIAFIFLMGHVSDVVGRRKVLVLACVAFVVASIPLFHLMSVGSLWVVVLCEILFALILTTNDGTLASFLAESFPTSVRYSGFALSFNLANTLLGGTCPFVATWLILVSGSQAAPAYYLTAVAGLALVSLLVSHWAPPLDLSVVKRSTR